jgi:hypothetical protein
MEVERGGGRRSPGLGKKMLHDDNFLWAAASASLIWPVGISSSLPEFSKKKDAAARTRGFRQK